MTEPGRRSARIAAASVVGGCRRRVRKQRTVVLLPADDGKPAAVTVRQGEREIVLDQPYAAARVTPLGPSAYRASAQEVETHFGPALAARPSRPATFTLYFIEGKDEFTEESKQVVDRILTEIARRPVPDVRVVGHTDAVGSDPFNDALGQQRADVVRAALVRLGVPSADIEAVSRGKRAAGDSDARRRRRAAQSSRRDRRALTTRPAAGPIQRSDQNRDVVGGLGARRECRDVRGQRGDDGVRRCGALRQTC